jgi:flagellar biosynthesis/type III secretory pathway ATPase
LLSKKKNQIERAHLISLCWAYAFTATFNKKKSVALGKVKLFVKEKELEMVDKVKIVGRLLSMKGKILDMPEERPKELKRRLEKIERVPGSKEDRLRLIGACALPILFGMEASDLKYETTRQLRQEIWQDML